PSSGSPCSSSVSAAGAWGSAPGRCTSRWPRPPRRARGRPSCWPAPRSNGRAAGRGASRSPSQGPTRTPPTRPRRCSSCSPRSCGGAPPPARRWSTSWPRSPPSGRPPSGWGSPPRRRASGSTRRCGTRSSGCTPSRRGCCGRRRQDDLGSGRCRGGGAGALGAPGAGGHGPRAAPGGVRATGERRAPWRRVGRHARAGRDHRRRPGRSPGGDRRRAGRQGAGALPRAAGEPPRPAQPRRGAVHHRYAHLLHVGGRVCPAGCLGAARVRLTGAHSPTRKDFSVATTNDLKNGMVLVIDGQLWSVVEFLHVKPGKGPAFVRTKLKNVLSGKIVDKTFNAGVKVETATVDRREMQYLYQDGADYVFMDTSTYDQLTVGGDVVGDAANFLLEGQNATVAMHEGQVLYIELPASVVLEITYTEPGLQGDRSSAGTKP